MLAVTAPEFCKADLSELSRLYPNAVWFWHGKARKTRAAVLPSGQGYSFFIYDIFTRQAVHQGQAATLPEAKQKVFDFDALDYGKR